MIHPSLRGLTTIPVTHYHPVISPSHIAKQRLLYSTALMNSRNYNTEKRDENTKGEFSYYTYTYTYMHACMHAYIHTYIHTYIHACMHAYIHTYVHT